MKTKNLLQLALIVIAVIGITVSGCKKKTKDDGDPDTTSLQQLSKDEADMQAASDDAANDANDVLSRGTSKSIEGLPCNATFDSSAVAGDTITYTITYNGLNCTGKFNRTGTIKFTKKVSTPWRDAGAFLKLTFINFKVTKVATNKSLTLNGTHTFTNVSGGLIKQLGISILTPVIHRISGTMQATFDDNSTRTWNVARQRTWTGTFGQYVVTVEGYGSEGTYTNLVTWGTNRNGEVFYTQINQELIHKQTCGWDPVTGIKKHSIPSYDKSVTATFGYDSNNQPVTGTNCPTKFKLDWVKGSNSGTIYLPI
ncbi:MAG: hypothetical protein HY958_00020 [Bacteroidia bacterium]|nr:hypothetical protein [Bacteroidia bacterium]